MYEKLISNKQRLINANKLIQNNLIFSDLLIVSCNEIINAFVICKQIFNVKMKNDKHTIPSSKYKVA